jgi:hypothetical protein
MRPPLPGDKTRRKDPAPWNVACQQPTLIKRPVDGQRGTSRQSRRSRRRSPSRCRSASRTGRRGCEPADTRETPGPPARARPGRGPPRPRQRVRGHDQYRASAGPVDQRQSLYPPACGRLCRHPRPIPGGPSISARTASPSSARTRSSRTASSWSRSSSALADLVIGLAVGAWPPAQHRAPSPEHVLGRCLNANCLSERRTLCSRRRASASARASTFGFTTPERADVANAITAAGGRARVAIRPPASWMSGSSTANRSCARHPNGQDGWSC